MEQKKLLLVAISVGVFLVIAIGAAILVFGSGNSSPAMISSRPIAPGSSMMPELTASGLQVRPASSEIVTTAAGVPPVNGNPVIVVQSEAGPAAGNGNIGVNGNIIAGNNGVITNGNTGVISNTNTGAVNGNSGVFSGNTGAISGNAGAGSGGNSGVTSNNTGANTPVTSDRGNSSTVISVSRPSTTAVPDVPPANRQVSAARGPAGASSVQTTPAAPGTAPGAVSRSVTPSTPAPAASNVSPASKPAPRTYNDFWIQTGSFTTVSRAETVKDTLSSKGITSIIENRMLDGTAYYRVRVGPYTSKNEADYWLSLIQSIKGFENSQVWESQSVR